MDRRNGGESLAPPRPPKSLPRVHRPRAPEPPMMSASNLDTNSTTAILHSCNIPEQPPQFQQHQSQQQQQHQQQFQSHNQICTNNHIHQNRNNNNIISNINNNLNSPNSNIVNSNINSNNNNNNNNINNNINSNITAQRAPLTAPLIPLHSSTNNISNISNINNLGSTTTSTNLTSTNSFTRRRPQTPIIGLQILPPPTTPLLSSSNLLLHTNNNELSSSSSLSPVTLAAPRPENERLSNEYVDTPLRSATTANLHHATRIQHPAGQTIRGQTTTPHNLLHNQRQHLQLHNNSHNHHHHQPQHHQIHFNSTTSHSSNIINNHNNNINISNSSNERHRQTSNVPSSISTVGGGSAGGSSGTLRQIISSEVCGIDGSSNTLHSNNIRHKNIISKTNIGTICGDPMSTSTTLSSTTSTVHSPTTPTTNNQSQRIIPGTVVRQINHQSQQSTNHSSTILPITEPITKQPVPFSKDCLCASMLHEELDLHHLGSNNTTSGNLTSGGGSGNSTNNSDYLNSITCPNCKKCRCEQCQSPRQLPSKWVCNKTCLCSAETVIDYASCLCCVKALFYHCSKDHEMECDDGTDSISCADDPCSCLPHKRATRWGWLGALSMALPCLWFYWPMRGCIAVCAKCYARHARHGCRCNNYQSQIGSTSSMLPIAPVHNNQITTTKSSSGGNVGSGVINNSNSGGSGGINSGINSSSGNHHHHHQHHFNNGGVSRIIRTNDLTPEKRLLDSSPEY